MRTIYKRIYETEKEYIVGDIKKRFVCVMIGFVIGFATGICFESYTTQNVSHISKETK